MALKSSKPRSALKSTIEEGEIQDEDGNFEAYDPVKWEAATGGETVDKTSGIIRDAKYWEKEYERIVQEKFPLEPEFVRALKDSKMGTKPYFRKGHILRVINTGRHGKLDGEWKRFGIDGRMPDFI